jgi:hypothetical protein
MSGSFMSNYAVNIHVALANRVETLAITRPHPINIYDLQSELQQRFNIPIHEQNISFNGMSLGQIPADVAIESVGIVNNSQINISNPSIVYNNQATTSQYMAPWPTSTTSYYGDVPQIRDYDYGTR